MTEQTPDGSSPNPNTAPQLIVDSDWKAQAQAEKEKLASEQAQKTAPQGKAGAGEAPTPFMGLLASLATQALLYMGGIADPETGRAVVSPQHAQHYIEMLAVLQEKTKGNLTKEEREELEGVLHELRMRFVQIAGKLDELAAQQEAQERRAPGGADSGASASTS